MNIEFRRLLVEDVEGFIELVRLFGEVFDMQPFHMPPLAHLEGLLSKRDFIAFAALQNDEVIGGLTAYVLQQYYSERSLAYLYDLAVKQAFQRHGVGKKLMAAFTRFCAEQGFEEVFVQADKADGYAINFYRKTGITAEEEVVHFYYSFQKQS